MNYDRENREEISCRLRYVWNIRRHTKNKEEWKDKSDCTEEAIETVRDYLVQECLGGLHSDKTTGGYSWKLKDGRIVKLMIAIEEGEINNE